MHSQKSCSESLLSEKGLHGKCSLIILDETKLLKKNVNVMKHKVNIEWNYLNMMPFFFSPETKPALFQASLPTATKEEQRCRSWVKTHTYVLSLTCKGKAGTTDLMQVLEHLQRHQSAVQRRKQEGIKVLNKPKSLLQCFWSIYITANLYSHMLVEM